MKAHERIIWRLKRQFPWNSKIFLDINTQAMHMYPRIFLAKRKIAWNREFISSNRRIKISYTKREDIWRMFQEKRFHTTEIGMNTMNIGDSICWVCVWGGVNWFPRISFPCIWRRFCFKKKKAHIIITISCLWQYKLTRRWLRLKHNMASGLLTGNTCRNTYPCATCHWN